MRELGRRHVRNDVRKRACDERIQWAIKSKGKQTLVHGCTGEGWNDEV